MTFPWRTVRIFISSTFRDMQAERDWLVRFVFPRLREELLPRRIALVDVDLRWGVTSDQDALGVCREVIDECWPRFMGVLGGRYGWVPPGRTESITADEIHYGVLAREAGKRGQAFFYFRDPQATADIVEETPGDFREPNGSEAANKLTALKQAIADAGLPVFIYPAKWDAAQQRLAGLEAFGNQVHTDLLRSLKDDPELAARFTTEGTAPPDEFAEEAEQMEAFIEERTDRFVLGSREPLMRDMLAFATSEGTPNIFVLTGDPGSGKSAFLAKFVRSSAVRSSAFRRFPSPPKGGTPSTPLLITHFIGASTGSTDLRRTLRRLCHDIALAAGNTEPLPLDIKDLITHFQKLLAEAAGRRRVILVFDALNQFDATDGAHWLNWLPRELPPGVRIVASVIAPADGQPEHQTLAILRTRPGTRMEKLEPLTEADTLAVIEGSLRRYAKRLSPEQLAALLAKPAGRLPLYVLTALEELRTLGTYEEITARIQTLPGDARALFGWILTERLARDPGFRDREGRPCGAALVERFAACLGVSRHGLSPAELAALLDPGDPLGNVAALLRLLRPYLMRRGELLDFYHGQFREAVTAKYLHTERERRTAHGWIADHFETFEPHSDQRRNVEMPWHLAKANDWKRLASVLSEDEAFRASLWNAWDDRHEAVTEYWKQIERKTEICAVEAYKAIVATFIPGNFDAVLVSRLLEKLGHYDAALEMLDRLIHMCRVLDNISDYCEYLDTKCSLLRGKGDFVGAMEVLKEVEAVKRKHYTRDGLLARMGEKGNLDSKTRQWIMETHKSDDDELELAANLGNQALVLEAQGDHGGALELHRQAGEIYKRHGEQSGWAFALLRQANVHRQVAEREGDVHCRQAGMKTAESLSLEAEEIYRALGDGASVSDAIFLRAGIRHFGGEYEAVIKLLEKAAAVLRGLGNSTRLRVTLSRLAETLASRGEDQRAQTLFQELRELCIEADDQETLTHCNRSLIKLVAPGLAALRPVNDDVLRAHELFARASGLMKEEFWDEAIAHFAEAETLFRKSGDRKWAREALHECSMTIRMKGDKPPQEMITREVLDHIFLTLGKDIPQSLVAGESSPPPTP